MTNPLWNVIYILKARMNFDHLMRAEGLVEMGTILYFLIF